MPSTYSNLKIQLMATGENASTWGTVTNTNLGTAIEEAIVGSADVVFASGNVTLTLSDTNGTQPARNVRLNLTGTTGGSTRNLVVPSIEKPYIIDNGCADNVVVKTAAGTGVTVPPGKTMWVYSDGTNVVNVTTHLTDLTLGNPLPIASGGLGNNTGSGAALTSLNASNISSGTLALARGGTGASTNSAARVNLLPSYTGNAGKILALNVGGTDVEWVSAGGSGTVNSVNASTSISGLSFSGGPITSSGTLTLSGTLGAQGGGTGLTSPGTAGNVLTSNGTAWVSQAAGGTGVTTISFGSTGLTPSTATNGAVTVSGTLAVANGGTGQNTYTNGQLLIGNSSTGGLAKANLTAGSGISITNGAGTITIASTAGGGTVTSVSGTGSANGLSLSGTVTTTGNITLSGSVTSVATTATIDGVTIGYRSIPRSTTSGTATTGDVGKCIAVSAGLTIPASTFAAGDAVSVYNNSASSVTLTQGSGLTLRLAGTTTTGSRTLAARGIATIWFNSATEAVVSGAGVT